MLQVDCEVGAPRVNYREAITQRTNFDYLHKKQSGSTRSGSIALLSSSLSSIAWGHEHPFWHGNRQCRGALDQRLSAS